MQPLKTTLLPVYCIGGLGVDERVFQHYHFPGDKIVLPYFTPQAGDDICSYADKLAERITHDHFILLGISFGGILAQQIALAKKPAALILISSIQSYRQIPRVYRVAMKLGGSRGLRLAWKTDIPFTRNYFFTAREKTHRRTLQRIYEATDFDLVAWSLPLIMKWEGVDLPDDLPKLILHGCRDKFFPVGRRADIDECIEGAGHFMVVSHHKKVRTSLEEFLSTR
ncbi:alpha/beta fold hydrolase [Roseivirga sp. BDSF3-8]|uniref:alpha/beta fold hydrolase n=1 Tax=Roseivirga sp. BDSF3-8 TaxID=3241598 RepID=UPI00353255C8